MYGKNLSDLYFLEKFKLLEFLSENIGKNISKIKSIFIGNRLRFGNKIIAIYKTIFYCQILRCKRIFLDKNKIWFIKREIINKKFHMIIKPIYENNVKSTIKDNTFNFFYYKQYIYPHLNIELFKKEILNNIPRVKTIENDLYIYIRSGDIFIRPVSMYSQAPLCFYKKILNFFKFNKIHLIAENKNNPVIIKLLQQYPNVIFNKNSLKIDIAYLSYSYHLVAGRISTFLGNIIPLNNNLLILWVFKLKKYIKKKVNILWFQKKLKTFIMYASLNYINKMKIWKNTKPQLDLMVNEICKDKFII